ncbi:hypothetical protein P9112_010034 [Eukaryota sp. TZLM1-RC]
MVQELPIDVWNKCFTSSLLSVPSRFLSNLHRAVVKLQKSVLIGFEDLDFSKRFSVTKINNPVFAAFLSDIQNCTSLISQQPRPFGLHLTNEAWKQNMRLKSGVHRSGILDNSVCMCNEKPTVNSRHTVSCKKFLQYRSALHNAVRDVTYEMSKCYNFSCKIEPLLKHYSDNNLFNSRRGDLIAPFVDSSQVVVDFTTVDSFAFIYRDDILKIGLLLSCNEVEFDSTNEELDTPHSPNSAQYVEPQNRLNVNLPSSPRSSLHIPLSALDKSLLVEHLRQNFAPNTVVKDIYEQQVYWAIVYPLGQLLEKLSFLKRPLQQQFPSLDPAMKMALFKESPSEISYTAVHEENIFQTSKLSPLLVYNNRNIKVIPTFATWLKKKIKCPKNRSALKQRLLFELENQIAYK